MTPDPRGFAVQSFTQTICDNSQMFDRRHRKHDAEPILADRPIVPRKYLAALEASRLTATVSDRTPRATASIGYEERKLFIPTGKRKMKKNGEQGAEEKIPVILVIVTATVSDGIREFTFTASNRATKILDSRDRTRKPLDEVERELHRLCPPDVANSTATTLAAYLAPARERKPRVKAAPIDSPARPPALELTVKRVPFSARKHLLDPIWVAIGARESAVERFDREVANAPIREPMPA